MQRESHQKIIAMLHRYVDLRGRWVLEVGCGEGRVTAGIKDLPQQLVALDPDAERLCQARQSMPAVDFRCGSGESLEFADQSFDLVLFTLSLHHQDGRRALAEAARVLRDSGRVVVVEPVNEGELERVLSVLDDETEAVRQAQEAVRRSALREECSETFCSRWIFVDRDDLVHSLFAYYAKPLDHDLALRLTAALGGKREHRPIILEDRLLIQVLRK